MEFWEELYARVGRGNPLRGCRCLLAYNSVLDLVRGVDEEFLAALPTEGLDPSTFSPEPQDLRGVAQALAYSMAHGAALELLCPPELLDRLQALGPHEVRPGGQVVTIATLLSNFSAHRVVVHPDRFDPRVAALYSGTNAVVPRPRKGGLEFIPASTYSWDCQPEVHVILEYAEGQQLPDGPQAPRANRLILAPTTPVQFHPEFEDSLAHVALACDRAILAGLNHMGHHFEESYAVVRRHIETLRSANPALRIHLEFTSMQREEKRGAVLRDLLPLVDSAGLNEVELSEAVQALGAPWYREARHDIVAQLRAIRMMQNLGVPRIHLHTLGYYLCATDNHPEACREALLFSALVAAAAALRGRVPNPRDIPEALAVPVSGHGLDRLCALGEHFTEKGLAGDAFAATGILEPEGLVLVPTKVVERPRTTVGLGDLISGAAFAVEPWKE